MQEVVRQIMLKAGFIILLIVGSCYCLEDLIEDARAKKKSPAKLIGKLYKIVFG